MNGWPPAMKAYVTFRKEVLNPLMRVRLYEEMYEEAEIYLAATRDPDVRFTLMSEMSLFVYGTSDEGMGFRWLERLCDEFPENPFAWTRMAGWYCLRRDPTPEQCRIALGHYKTALARARTADEWVRSVLFSICRLHVSAEDWSALEARMREIIDDLENKREIDIPFLEDDWLRFLMPGTLDDALVIRYRSLVAADRARRRGLSEAELRPATLDELEP